MEVHFTTDQEAQLAQLAAKAGTDAEQLVKDAILRLIEDETRCPLNPALLMRTFSSTHFGK
jgi:hypothetical protein